MPDVPEKARANRPSACSRKAWPNFSHDRRADRRDCGENRLSTVDEVRCCSPDFPIGRRRGEACRVRIRWLTGAVMIMSGCATPRIAVEAILAKAEANEVAAARGAEGKDVFVAATVLNITFLAQDVVVTEGSHGRWASRANSEKVKRRVPYVSLLTANNSVVYCFPTPEHVGTSTRWRRESRRTSSAPSFRSTEAKTTN
jgi:hypothetical protein